MSHTPRSHSRKQQPTAQAGEQAVHLYNEGVTLQAQGKTSLAESAFRRALSMQPEFAEAHNNLGNVLLEQKKWKPAEKSFRRALQLFPDNAMLLGNIGKALHGQGKTAAALDTLRQAIRLDPYSAMAVHTLGTVLMEAGKTDEAIEQFGRAHELRPDSPEIANDLGLALYRQERYEEATGLLHATVKAHPRFFDAYPNLADAACKLGAVDDAIKVLNEAAKLEPDNAAIHTRLARIYFARTEYLEARSSISRAIAINPHKADYFGRLGQILFKMHLYEDAQLAYSKALALRPDSADYHNNLGLVLKALGKTGEADTAFRSAIRLDPDCVGAHANLAHLTRHTQHDEDVRRLESLLEAGNFSDEERIPLYFGLGKTYDDLGDYEKAFDCFLSGNTLKNRQSPETFDLQEEKDTAKEITATFTRQYIQQHQDTGYAEYTPLFITGLPRSGKTVIETILARHSTVTAGGESADFTNAIKEILSNRAGATFPGGLKELDPSAFEKIGRTYAGRTLQRLEDSNCVSNTIPASTNYIGLIRLSLPNAKVILCQREAKDTCTAIYCKDFASGQTYSRDPETLGRYHNLYRNLMEHWHRQLPEFVHVVQFEDLLRNPENQINAILDFCGLPREEACLDTASLPKPDTVIGIWEHYRESLKPLYEILDAR